MEGTILVTPEALKTTATEFNGVMGQVQNLTNSMVEQVNGLSARWQGESSTAYINKFNQLNDDIAKITAKINEHVTDLNEMANRYLTDDRETIEVINSLAGDVLG